MSDTIQSIVFPGAGLDSDSDLSYVANGDSLGDRNILIGEDGNNGVKTNMKGNTSFQVGTEYPNYVGSCFDAATRCAYWIGHDASGNTNEIERYNVDTGLVSIIFTDSANYFGINAAYKMKDVRLLDNRLYFNPRVSEPKVIDLTMAYNYENVPAWTAVAGYAINTTRRFYGGLFKSNAATAAGESPSTTPTKWDRIGDSYDTYANQQTYAFNVIKKAPTAIPTVTYESDTTLNSNNIRGKLFRFAYRYRYFDDSYSVYSSLSELATPLDEERYDGEVLNAITYNNKISITVNAGSAALVKEIEVIYQESGGDWKKIDTIDRQEQTKLTTDSFSIDFYNNLTYEAVANADVDKIYDLVPRTVACQEIINKNVMLYGRVKEGFDNMDSDDLDVTLTPVKEEIVLGSSGGTTRRDNVASGDLSTWSEWDPLEENYIFYTRIRVGTWFPSGVVAGDYYELTVDGYNGIKVLAAGDVDTATHLGNAMGVTVAYPTGWFGVGSDGSGVYVDIGSRDNYPDVSKSIFYSAGGTTLQTKKKGFKTGAKQPFCIYYYDEALRRGDAQVCDDLSVYIPMLAETSPLVTTTNYRYKINWSVGHLPPSWARYWRFGFAGNGLCSYFVQYIVSAINFADTAFNSRMTIDVTSLQTIKTTTTANWNQFPNSIIDPYVWEQGDRVRFVTRRLSGTFISVADYSGTVPGTIRINTAVDHTLATGNIIVIDSGTYSGTYTITVINTTSFYVTKAFTVTATGAYRVTSGAVLGTIYDYEISSYDDTTNKLLLQTGITPFLVGESSLIEIYRPVKTNTKTIYYEYGSLYPVITDSLGVSVHGGSTTNQDTGTAADATGTFIGGDAYHIMRTPDKPFNETVGFTTKGIIHESMWYSDFYLSSDWSKGKIGFKSDLGEKTLNIIRWSNAYLQNTALNGLSTFEALNYKELSDIYGNIVGMIENGDTLKVYMTTKTASIGIGLKEWVDANGNVTTSSSSDVLGYVRYSPQKYGTIYPESLTQNNRFIYGFDIYTGTMWRDSANGIFPISGRYEDAGGGGDYKMETYFKTKAKALLVSGAATTSVQTVWDDEYKLLYVLFSDTTTRANSDVVAFHEPSNRWVSSYDFKIDTATPGVYDAPCWVQSIGNVGFLSFGQEPSGSSVWKHNSNTAARCSFFGNQQTCVIGCVANKNGGVTKVMDSIFLHTNGDWSGTVTIPANLNYPNGMYSILPAAKFKRREGKLMSEFMRNGKTTSNTANVLEYINGEPLRGYAADIRLSNTATTKVSMLMIDVNMTKSDV